MDSKKIYIIADVNADNKPSSLSLELLGLGSSLAADIERKVCVLLLGSDIKDAAGEIAEYGADVIAVDSEALKDYNPSVYLSVVKDLLKEDKTAVILAGHTAMGQDLLPRLAFSMQAGLVTDCIGIEADKDEGNLCFNRYIYGGNALASQKVKTAVSMATVRPRVGTILSSASDKGEVSFPAVEIINDPVIQIKEKKIAPRELDLEDAPVVISGGRGMGGKEGFQKLEVMASLLKGAVGASRPPIDSEWISPTRQIGITGKVVAPDLYVAVAISGSTQHLSGISESGVIVAINKDEEAYIFKTSDYGVVGDWQKVLPSFTDTLKELIKE